MWDICTHMRYDLRFRCDWIEVSCEYNRSELRCKVRMSWNDDVTVTQGICEVKREIILLIEMRCEYTSEVRYEVGWDVG